MKKILSIILAMAMMLSMGVMSFAATTVGDIYEMDEDGKLTTYSGDLVPGKTYYIYAGAKDADPKPTKIILETEGHDYNHDKKVRILSSENLSVSLKKMDTDVYAYFGAMKLKSITASAYDDSDIQLDVTDAKVRKSDGAEDPITGKDINGMHSIRYDDVYDITEDLGFISLDDDTDTYDIEDTDAYVEIDSEGVKTEMLVSCDTSYDVRFGEKYPSANLDFYYFNGARARRPAKIVIPKDEYKYVYEKTDAGLKDVTKVEGKNFVIKTPVLGKYVLSDVALATAVTPAVPPVTPAVPGTQGPTGGNIPFNPGTGAAL